MVRPSVVGEASQWPRDGKPNMTIKSGFSLPFVMLVSENGMKMSWQQIFIWLLPFLDAVCELLSNAWYNDAYCLTPPTAWDRKRWYKSLGTRHRNININEWYSAPAWSDMYSGREVNFAGKHEVHTNNYEVFFRSNHAWFKYLGGKSRNSQSPLVFTSDSELRRNKRFRGEKR